MPALPWQLFSYFMTLKDSSKPHSTLQVNTNPLTNSMIFRDDAVDWAFNLVAPGLEWVIVAFGRVYFFQPRW